jgi:hypothetical protein
VRVFGLGAARAREETHPQERADALAELVLKDHEGLDVRIGDLWQDRPAVLAFLRHYG